MLSSINIIVQCPFSVRNSGQLMLTSVIQGPGHNFAAEDPIFLEDANITTGEKVVRQRQFPQVFIPSAPLGTGQVGNLSLQDQRLHQTTGEILARSGQQQQPQPHPSASSPPVPSQSTTVDMPPSGSKQSACSTSAGPTTILNTRGTISTPVRSVRKYQSQSTSSSVFHKQYNFVCIICQHSTQRKVDMSRHMKSHQVGGSP